MDSVQAQQPVFLVDDDPDAGLLTSYALKKSGITNPLRTWFDPAKALAHWETLEASTPAELELPLFFLIDLRMPEISGFEVLSWLRERPVLGSRPRIVMSSSLDRRDAAIANDLGAHGYLTKYPAPSVLAAIAAFAREHCPERAAAFAEFTS